MALVKTCPTCGFGNQPTTPFCSECGVSLVAVTPGESVPPSSDNQQRIGGEQIPCPDCGAEIDSSSGRCVYCDCALPIRGETLNPCAIKLVWPWGSEMLTQPLRIGRDPPAPEALIAIINAHGYDNISRSHAELNPGTAECGATVVDLGSTNGTFVDGVRILANKATILKNGAVVRFAANLSVTVFISSP
jgi:FHA domain/Double zinc ribbon